MRRIQPQTQLKCRGGARPKQTCTHQKLQVRLRIIHTHMRSPYTGCYLASSLPRVLPLGQCARFHAKPGLPCRGNLALFKSKALPNGQGSRPCIDHVDPSPPGSLPLQARRHASGRPFLRVPRPRPRRRACKPFCRVQSPAPACPAPRPGQSARGDPPRACRVPPRGFPSCCARAALGSRRRPAVLRGPGLQLWVWLWHCCAIACSSGAASDGLADAGEERVGCF